MGHIRFSHIRFHIHLSHIHLSLTHFSHIHVLAHSLPRSTRSSSSVCKKHTESALVERVTPSAISGAQRLLMSWVIQCAHRSEIIREERVSARQSFRVSESQSLRVSCRTVVFGDGIRSSPSLIARAHWPRSLHSLVLVSMRNNFLCPAVFTALAN